MSNNQNARSGGRPERSALPAMAQNPRAISLHANQIVTLHSNRDCYLKSIGVGKGMNDFLNGLPGYNLRRASNAVLAELAEGLGELDFRPTDVSMLITVDDNPHITPSELGRILGIQRANMVPMVARMEERGAIKRIKLDGRSFGLELTDQGINLCERAKDILLSYERRFLERVPAEHRDHLLPALRALWDQKPD